MDRDKSIIRRTLRRVQLRLYLARAARQLLGGLLVVTIATVLLLALQRAFYSWLPIHLRHLQILHLAAWIILIIAPLLALLQRTTLKQAARHLDSQGRLQDRVATAWQLMSLTGRDPAGTSPMADLVVTQAEECCRRANPSAIGYHHRRTFTMARLLAVALVAMLALLIVPPYRTAAVREQEAELAATAAALGRAGRQLDNLPTMADDAHQVAATRAALEQLRQAIEHGADEQAIRRATQHLQEQVDRLTARRQARAALAALTQQPGQVGRAMNDDQAAQAARRQLAAAAADDAPDADTQAALQHIGSTAAEAGAAMDDQALSRAGQEALAAAQGLAQADATEAALATIAEAGRQSARALASQPPPMDDQINQALAMVKQARQRAQATADLLAAARREDAHQDISRNDPPPAAATSPDAAAARAATVEQTVSDWQRRYDSEALADAQETAPDAAQETDQPATGASDGATLAPPTSDAQPPDIAARQEADAAYINSLPVHLRQLVRDYFDRQ